MTSSNFYFIKQRREDLRESYTPGGGVLSIFVLRGCAVFQGIVFAYFFWNRVSKEGKFSGAGCQNMSKEEILLQQANFWSNFRVFEYTFQRFFLEQGII